VKVWCSTNDNVNDLIAIYPSRIAGIGARRRLMNMEPIIMALTELLPVLRQLSRGDKWRAMQFLVSELAKDEEVLLASEPAYPVWSPYDAFDAAESLLTVLEADRQRAGA
jgi:hypothetical protein